MKTSRANNIVQLLVAQAKADLLVFGSMGLPGRHYSDHKVKDPYSVAETAIVTGQRQGLGSSRVREAVFGHAVSALAAHELLTYLNQGAMDYVPSGVFDAVATIPAANEAILHKHAMAVALLGLPHGAGGHHVTEMFGVLGVQTFLTAPIPSGEHTVSSVLHMVQQLPGTAIADGVGAGSLRTWYQQAVQVARS